MRSKFRYRSTERQKQLSEISADASKEEALAAGKEAIADKLTGNVDQRDLCSEEDH